MATEQLQLFPDDRPPIREATPIEVKFFGEFAVMGRVDAPGRPDRAVKTVQKIVEDAIDAEV